MTAEEDQDAVQETLVGWRLTLRLFFWVMGDRTPIEPIGNVHGILGKFIYINASYKAEMPEALNIITAPSALISNLDKVGKLAKKQFQKIRQSKPVSFVG